MQAVRPLALVSKGRAWIREGQTGSILALALTKRVALVSLLNFFMPISSSTSLGKYRYLSLGYL